MKSNLKYQCVVTFIAMGFVQSVAASSGPLGADHCDFDGDNRDDQAFGVPGDSIAGIFDVGGVNVLYGSAAGLNSNGDQWWHQNSSGVEGVNEAGDLFGSSLACGDFNGDGFDDLAIGSPGEGVGSTSDAGSVNILYGSPVGLASAGDQLWHQNSAGVKGTAESNDDFGSALAAGDFNNDGFEDLAIGAPGETIGSGDAAITDAGAVNVLFGAPSGLTASGDQIWHQNSSGVLGVAERSDSFGSTITSGDFNDDGFKDLAIGSPGENIGSNITDAGAVNVLYGAPSGLTANGDQIWHQNSNGVLGIAEAYDRLSSALSAGDFDGDGYADLAMGVPGESVDEIAHAGAVNVLYGGAVGLTANGDQIWTQNSPGVLGDHEAYDRFGTSLVSGDFDGDGRNDLAIGAPWDSIAGTLEVGVVNVLYGTNSGLGAAGDDFWHQNITGVNGLAESYDRLGSTLSSGDFDGDGRDDLAMGVPGESIGNIADAGAVNVLYGQAAGLTTDGDQIWHQNQPGVLGGSESFDRFSGLLKSDGLYRIPYTNGTTVRVSRDHLTHSPQKNRIDMFGTGSGPHTIVAAAAGTIQFIVDSNAEPTNSNNYVWIAHANGEWTKYSHFVTNSVTDLGHQVGDNVSAGTALGVEGNVGQASGVHLHFEVGIPWNVSDPISGGGFIKGENRDPVICGIPGQSFLAGVTYTGDNC